MEVVLARPRGFCAGVSRAVEVVDQALALYGRPVYVYHEIVHNQFVVADLARRGAVFVDDIESIPEGSVTVFSAHGVADRVCALARTRHLRVIDATCPLVAKVHQQARKYSVGGYELVIIGHRGHEEVEGTAGSVATAVHVVASIGDIDALPIAPDARVAYVTQTTLSVDDTRALIKRLRERWPQIAGPDLEDICYATTNRQNAVRDLARHVDLVLVVGARNSSNSNRLCEVARQSGTAAHLVQDASEIDARWLEGVEKIGVTAGASAPEVLVAGVRRRLAALGALRERQLPGPREPVRFRMPKIEAAGLP